MYFADYSIIKFFIDEVQSFFIYKFDSKHISMTLMKMIYFFTFVIFSFSNRVHAQSTASAQVSIFKIKAPQLYVEKKIWMYLPKAYTQPNTKYAVI